MINKKNNQEYIPETDIPTPDTPTNMSGMMKEDSSVQDYPSFNEAEDDINRTSLNQEVPYSEPEPSEFNPSIMEQNVPTRTQEQIPQKSKVFSTPIPQQQPVNLEFGTSLDDMEELIESVVEDKWRSFIENFGDIAIWKDKVRTELISVKQELIRLEDRFENLQRAVLGRIQTYDRNILEVGTEIKALEKVFQNIIQPLNMNIKELSRITSKMKK